MDLLRIRLATIDDEPAIVDAIVLAFTADPMWRWAWPTPHTFLVCARAFVRAFTGAAIAHGSAYCSEDLVAACLWLRPGVHGDDAAVDELFGRSLTPARLADLQGIAAQMERFHPKEPHWYLSLIGVDPAHQGKGYGSALLTRSLQECDREQMPAYLESSNAKNVPLYARYGFVALGALQAGGSPTMVPMVRAAR